MHRAGAVGRHPWPARGMRVAPRRVPPRDRSFAVRGGILRGGARQWVAAAVLWEEPCVREGRPTTGCPCCFSLKDLRPRHPQTCQVRGRERAAQEEGGPRPADTSSRSGERTGQRLLAAALPGATGLAPPRGGLGSRPGHGRLHHQTRPREPLGQTRATLAAVSSGVTSGRPRAPSRLPWSFSRGDAGRQPQHEKPLGQPPALQPRLWNAATFPSDAELAHLESLTTLP